MPDAHENGWSWLREKGLTLLQLVASLVVIAVGAGLYFGQSEGAARAADRDREQMSAHIRVIEERLDEYVRRDVLRSDLDAILFRLAAIERKLDALGR